MPNAAYFSGCRSKQQSAKHKKRNNKSNIHSNTQQTRGRQWSLEKKKKDYGQAASSSASSMREFSLYDHASHISVAKLVPARGAESLRPSLERRVVRDESGGSDGRGRQHTAVVATTAENRQSGRRYGGRRGGGVVVGTAAGSKALRKSNWMAIAPGWCRRCSSTASA